MHYLSSFHYVERCVFRSIINPRTIHPYFGACHDSSSKDNPRAYTHINLHTYMVHTYIYTHTRTTIHPYIHTYILLNTYMYIHTYMHTYSYVHIYIHTIILNTYTYIHIYMSVCKCVWTPNSSA
jgi:hypothetical protein